MTIFPIKKDDLIISRSWQRKWSKSHGFPINWEIEDFMSLTYPIIRRIFPSLIANDLVSVQPMNLPEDLNYIFTMDNTSRFYDDED